jgi:hypothetical protein
VKQLPLKQRNTFVLALNKYLITYAVDEKDLTLGDRLSNQ